MSLGLKRGTVELMPYDPEWARLFEQEKISIQDVLKDDALGIEHIGSTAIPGMDAKPILDLMVAVTQIDDYSEFMISLKKLGYSFMRDNRSEQEHILFVKGPEECRTHYLKLTTLGTIFWHEHLLFRDYLKNHPDRAEAYRKLKQDLLRKFSDDRASYTNAKAAFIQDTIRMAESEAPGQ